MRFYSTFVMFTATIFIVFCLFGTRHAEETVEVDTDTVEQTPFKEAASSTEVLSSKAYQELNIDSLKAGRVFDFETDINQLLGIIINSLYTNKDIFLRELISNASDALDKIRYQSLMDRTVMDSNADMQIYIRAFPEKRIIVIRDDGHGMTQADLIRELGTIARSGTKYFIEEFTKAKDADLNLIGQFGVGFYSTFLVAEKVAVISKHNDDDTQHVWVSTADGMFTMYDDPRGNTMGRGTEIVLYLKEGMDKYLDSKLLQQLIEKYSEFVPYPINLWTTFEKEVDASDYDEFIQQQAEMEDTFAAMDRVFDEEEDDEFDMEDDEGEAYDDESEFLDDMDDFDDEDDWDDEDEDVSIDEEFDEDFEKTKTVRYQAWKVVNQNQPLWTRNPKEIYKEEYQNFYKGNVIYNGMWNPLDWTHFKVEGNIEFSSILFVPKKHPDRWMPRNMTDGITLYVKRVMIQENVPSFLPRYLSFVTGVVDSNDLPLHISRELLQKSKLIQVIKKKLVTKIFALLKKLAREERAKRVKEKNDKMAGMLDRPLEEPDEEAYPYTKFWQDWGVNIRLGIVEDEENRDELINMLRFYSTQSEDELTSLEEYVARMPEDQKYIYYLAGETFEQVRVSPFLERLKEKGYEVLYFTDAIDVYMVNHVSSYAGFDLYSATDSNIKFGDEKEIKAEMRKLKKEFKPLTKYLKNLLGSDVKEVKVGRRLTDSMSVVTAPPYGMTAYQYKLMKAQALPKGMSELDKMMMRERVLEINPFNDVVRKLNSIIRNNQRDRIARQMVLLMFDTALVRSGYDIAANDEMAIRIADVMREALRDQEIVEDEEIFEVEMDADEMMDLEGFEDDFDDFEDEDEELDDFDDFDDEAEL